MSSVLPGRYAGRAVARPHPCNLTRGPRVGRQVWPFGAAPAEAGTAKTILGEARLAAALHDG
jgi:hypothetical protein